MPRTQWRRRAGRRIRSAPAAHKPRSPTQPVNTVQSRDIDCLCDEIAALLCRQGFVSRSDALEIDQGFAMTQAAKMRDPDEILDRLGQSWMFEAVLHKFPACCHGVHAALEALIEARDRLDVRPDEVASVLLSVPPRYLEICNILEP